MNLIKGKIVEIAANFYYVSDCENKIWECFARARLLKEGKFLYVGDEVEIETTGRDHGVIVGLVPRKNCIQKPPVGNIDQVFVVFSTLEPDLDFYNMDRYLSYVRYELPQINVAICINKVDLKRIDILSVYKDSNFKIFYTSALTYEGLDLLLDEIACKVTVLAGPSGVGKSSLIKALNPNADIRIGTLSAIKAGKHITRNVKLVLVEDKDRKGYIADTPGFTRITFAGLNESKLLRTFPELKKLQCAYEHCLHKGEDGCCVEEAISLGLVSRARYENYTKILSETELEVIYGTKVETMIKSVGGKGKKIIPKISTRQRTKSRKREKQELQKIKIENEESLPENW